MTLTKEQREAIRAVSDLPRAIGCTRCHNYIQKNYSNQFAVLRSMIDNKDYVPNAAKLIELLAAGEHEQWADWAQAILDSEPGLSEGRKATWPGMIATPYENLSEELKDKDRREVHLRSGVALDHIQQQSIEIERLRGYEIAARDLSADLTKVAGDRDEHAARIKELESSLDEIERLRANVIAANHSELDLQLRIKELELSLDEAEALTKQNAELMNGYLGRIAELEDALAEYQRLGQVMNDRLPCLTLHGDCDRCSPRAKEVCEAMHQIAEGKIGPGDGA